jgi:hypothetical protein
MAARSQTFGQHQKRKDYITRREEHEIFEYLQDSRKERSPLAGADGENGQAD